MVSLKEVHGPQVIHTWKCREFRPGAHHRVNFQLISFCETENHVIMLCIWQQESNSGWHTVTDWWLTQLPLTCVHCCFRRADSNAVFLGVHPKCTTCCSRYFKVKALEGNFGSELGLVRDWCLKEGVQFWIFASWEYNHQGSVYILKSGSS